jgi:hypothetical protein
MPFMMRSGNWPGSFGGCNPPGDPHCLPTLADNFDALAIGRIASADFRSGDVLLRDNAAHCWDRDALGHHNNIPRVGSVAV